LYRVALTAAVAATLVVASASGQAWAAINLQVALWETGVAGQRECMHEFVRAFSHDNPDVIVCTEWRDARDADEWVRRWTGSFRDHAPDLTVMTDLWLAEYYRETVALPGDLQEELIVRLPESILARGTHAHRLRGVPWTVATDALYYRSDLFAEAGLAVPTTAEELSECAVTLADPPKIYGFGMPGSGLGGENVLHALASALGDMAPDEAGCVAPTLPPFVEALGLLVGMQGRGGLQPEVLTWSEVELADLMAQGRLGMMVGRPWVNAALLEADRERRRKLAEAEALDEVGAARAQQLRAAKIEWAQAPLPRTEQGATHLSVNWLVVMRSTDVREPAMRFARFVAHEDRQRVLAMLGGVPATRALVAELGETPPWAGHTQGLETARGLPLDQWEALSTQLGQALSYAISGRRTPAEALQRAGESG